MIKAQKNKLFERLFLAYTKRELQRHFHGVHVAGLETIDRIDRSLPIIVYCNHSSWWDALLAFILAREVFALDAYAMMEEKQLRRYRFFRLIGAFSVVRESPRAAVDSMRYAASLFTRPNVALWIYPQGVMVPNDVRPLRFYPGIARIAGMVGRVQFVPVAHRYEFLMQQRPEAFSLIGDPWMPEDPGTPENLAAALQKRLTDLLDVLRCRIAENELEGFRKILAGRMSVNERYDRIRLIRGDA
jgi:1-acyl-sn-glycerol-3-phosphate acyltransferase